MTTITELCAETAKEIIWNNYEMISVPYIFTGIAIGVIFTLVAQFMVRDQDQSRLRKDAVYSKLVQVLERKKK